MMHMVCRSYTCSIEKFIQKTQHLQEKQTSPKKLIRRRRTTTATRDLTSEAVRWNQRKTLQYFLGSAFQNEALGASKANQTLPISCLLAVTQMVAGNAGSKPTQTVSILQHFNIFVLLSQENNGLFS